MLYQELLVNAVDGVQLGLELQPPRNLLVESVIAHEQGQLGLLLLVQELLLHLPLKQYIVVSELAELTVQRVEVRGLLLVLALIELFLLGHLSG